MVGEMEELDTTKSTPITNFPQDLKSLSTHRSEKNNPGTSTFYLLSVL